MIRPPYTSHIGVVLENKYEFIHIMNRSRVTIERLDGLLWKRRVTGYYKPRQGVLTAEDAEEGQERKSTTKQDLPPGFKTQDRTLTLPSSASSATSAVKKGVKVLC